MALIHLDAGVLIGFLDDGDAHHEGARSVIVDALDRGDRMAMAASAMTECLVRPSRRGDDAIEVVHDLRRRLPLEIVDLDLDTVGAAARLRARHERLRLPDALVIATAVLGDADRLVTTDRRWPGQDALGLRSIQTL